jgi:SEC-C motif
MAPLAAVCGSCRRLFVTDNSFGVTGGGSTEATLEDVEVGPCPYCGGMGHVPDGAYELSETVMRCIGSLTAEDKISLLSIATLARNQDLTADEVADRIEKEVPAAAGLAAALWESSTPIAAWLAVSIALLAWLHPMGGKQQSAPTARDLARAFDPAQEQVETKRAVTALREVVFPHRRRRGSRHTGNQVEQQREVRPRLRNSNVCWCGSGKKYKHCHGRP